MIGPPGGGAHTPPGSHPTTYEPGTYEVRTYEVRKLGGASGPAPVHTPKLPGANPGGPTMRGRPIITSSGGFVPPQGNPKPQPRTDGIR